ncbi:nucleoside hydrolase [Amnibacterium kyonggiense]|uniref:Purine nucleosidase n=1 Tax=Amnibacterium kyonggiense TaxID=595671 RepID=A0A4R7FRH7_9MICO|nr:nucleoside hydrolase [Amnibacterium kyonggiense]TDS80417.1 purine nucleosidase [Amnibacterium kyonggiense]
MSGAPWYLDCDTGIDDALTLGLLVAEGADLKGIGSVSGNLSAAGGARNTLDLMALMGRPDVPVAVGAHDPLDDVFHGVADFVHGANGIGGVELPHVGEPVAESAAEMLVRLAHEHPGALRVLAIGPLTNLALALRLDPDLPSLVADVVIMGGAAQVPGNVSAVAEANIWNDPIAAQAVFDAAWPVTMVGLDVTMLARFEETHRVDLASSGASGAALAAMLGVYFEYYTPVLGRPSCALHDPLAAAIALGTVVPTSAPVVPIEVDTTGGPGHGQTLVDLRSRFIGYPPQPGLRHRVVLEVPEGFGDALLEALSRLP